MLVGRHTRQRVLLQLLDKSFNKRSREYVAKSYSGVLLIRQKVRTCHQGPTHSVNSVVLVLRVERQLVPENLSVTIC